MKAQLVILGAVINTACADAQDWQPCQGPLKTRWAKDVSPNNALPEYPRMQMVRKDWLNLNGLWDLKLADGTEAKILVPYPVESALSGVMKHSDRLTYRRTLEVPKAWDSKRVLLHFGAVDWEAKVSVNGQELGRHRGGYDGFSFDITDALKNLLHLLADPGPAAQGGSLAFQLSGATNNLHHTLLRKGDGTFWLALFQEALSYEAKARRDLEVSLQPVTLKLPWTAPEIRLFRPNTSAAPTERIARSSEVRLEVPDEVLLVEIKPPQQAN